MIKTHKPRGHFWTHASAFQQTEQFRDIVYEECTPPPCKVLVRDPDDVLPEAKRAAKRMRIEKIADDFLNGDSLFISSARPCPQKLKESIVWNKKSWDDPNFKLPKVDLSKESSALWEDVEDDEAVLERFARRGKTALKSKSSIDQVDPSLSERGQDVTEEQAQASCGPVRRLKALQVTAGPSEEALRHAATLCARRTQRANSEVLVARRSSTRLQSIAQDVHEPRSEPNYGGDEKISPRLWGEWLSRRKLHALPASLDIDEDSADELSLSRFETPSTPSRLRRVWTSSQTAREQSPGRHPTNESFSRPPTPERDTTVVSIYDTRSAAWIGTDQVEDNAPEERLNDDSNSRQQASYHTAPEETEIEAERTSAQDDSQSTDNSQTRLLRSQGIKAVPRRSWASLNGNTPNARIEQPPKPATGASEASSSNPAVRRSLQESAQLNAGRATRGKRTKSTIAKTPQQSSATRQTRSAPKLGSSQPAIDAGLAVDQQRCMGAFRPEYTSAQPTQNGSTPFMFRKKDAGPLNDDGWQEGPTEQGQRKGRRRVTFPSSDSAEGGAKHAEEGKAAVPVSATAPVLDMSFEHDSSFAPNLNMALVNGHLNKILPAEAGSAGRSSAVKKALRRELRSSGAEITRCASEPPMSSQVEQSAEASPQRADSSIPIVSEVEKESRAENTELSQQPWPGTQAALNQAQRDLLTSPEEQKPNSVPGGEATSLGNSVASTAPPTTGVREPLKPLSQEPLPSTQAMIGNFEGFSTVKKPGSRRTYYKSPAPAPTAAEKASRASAKALEATKLSSTLSDPVVPTGDVDRRRSSSLRFSISSFDSSMYSTRDESLPLQKTPAQPLSMNLSTTSIATPIPILRTSSSRRSALKSSAAVFSNTRPSDFPEKEGRDDPTPIFSSGPPFPSFQAAQARSTPQREDSDLDRTIDDLTGALLNMRDMEGVLSQVG